MHNGFGRRLIISLAAARRVSQPASQPGSRLAGAYFVPQPAERQQTRDTLIIFVTVGRPFLQSPSLAPQSTGFTRGTGGGEGQLGRQFK